MNCLALKLTQSNLEHPVQTNNLLQKNPHIYICIYVLFLLADIAFLAVSIFTKQFNLISSCYNVNNLYIHFQNKSVFDG